MLKKEYNCFRCGYRAKKSNVQHHFRRTTACKREITCPYTDEEIKILNERQFVKEDYKKIKNGNIAEIINIDTQNQTINHITNNITNNHITINIPKIIPFDQDWDLSLIDYSDKVFLSIADQVYTPFLKLILENEINNNVIIDNYNTSKGLVFKKLNLEEKYHEITIEKIIDESMLKLNKLLHDIYDDILSKNEKYNNKNFNKRIDDQKKFINQKLNDYNNNKNTKIKIREFIHNIYIDKKDNAIQNQKLVIQNKDNIETEY